MTSLMPFEQDLNGLKGSAKPAKKLRKIMLQDPYPGRVVLGGSLLVVLDENLTGRYFKSSRFKPPPLSPASSLAC